MLSRQEAADVRTFVKELEGGGSDKRISDEFTDKNEVFRASIHSELQKFRTTEKYGELLEEHRASLDKDKKKKLAKRAGLSLNKSQDRAFNATQRLIDNRQFYTIHKPFDGYDDPVGIPVLEITKSDFYEAYGLTRQKDNRFKGRQTQKAYEALEDLQEEQLLIYERKKGKKSKLIITEGPLVHIKGLEKGGIELRAAPIFIDQIESFSVFKPSNLHEEIKSNLDGRTNYTKAIPNMISWANTKNFFPHKIGKEKLARKIGLSSYLENGQRKRVNEGLTESLEMAKELGFLLNYEYNKEVYHIYLNPIRASRYRQTLKGSSRARNNFMDELDRLEAGGRINRSKRGANCVESK